MEKFITEIPQETVDRIKWLAEKTGETEEIIIVCALIYGTMKLKQEMEEDE